MPVQIDRRAAKAEAKRLIQTAQVPPLRFTALLLAIDVGLNLISTAVSGMLGDSFGVLSFSFSFVGVLITLLSTVLMAGFTNYCLRIHRGETMPYESLFDAFSFAGKVILMEVLRGVLIALASMLFVIPGLILAFSYAFALYHLCEDPGVGVIEAMRRSRMEMRGYKWQLFLLLLSFWPLLLVLAAALGLCDYLLAPLFSATIPGELLYTLVYGVLTAAAELYLLPYIELATVGFYRRAAAQTASDL